jgi:pimeloyl-ACP methyl ester carboxylesterase
MLISNQFNCNNIKLHYIKGPDGGSPLILLHGLSDSWQSYLALIPFLIPYYTLYIPDLRGHGKSHKAESYRIVDYVNDIKIFLKDLFGGPVHIVGHSLGAAIALAIAAEDTEKCKSICLIEPFIFKDKLDDEKFRDYFTNCMDVCKRYRRIDSISKNIKETGTLARKRAADLLQLDIKTITTVLDKTVFDGFDTEELLSRISCPVLIMRGNTELEGFITKEKADYLKEKIKNCVIEYLGKSSHIVHVDQPVETARHLLEFFTSV